MPKNETLILFSRKKDFYVRVIVGSLSLANFFLNIIIASSFFRHYFLSRTEVYLSYEFEPKLFWSSTGCKKQTMQNKMEVIFVSRQLTFLFFLHFILNNLIFYNFYASL